MIITIDGGAGTGKSTVAKALSKRSGFLCFDTGPLYRACALYLKKRKVEVSEKNVAAEVSLFLEAFTFFQEEGVWRYFLEGLDVTGDLHGPELSLFASKVAVFPSVRKGLLKIQRDFGKRHNVIFVGRDMGSVVFPEAEVKIFLHASSKERARRRYAEFLQTNKNSSITLAQVEQDLLQRDQQDRTRSEAPLICPKGAYKINTTKLSVDSIVEKILQKKSFFFKKQHFYKFFGKRRSFAFYSLNCLCGISCFKTLYKMKVFGLEHWTNCRGGALIAANHSSYLDPLFITSFTPEPLWALGGSHISIYSGWGKRMLHMLGMIPITAGSSVHLSAFKEIFSKLADKRKVLIFPQGARLPYTFEPVRRGMTLLALKAKVPIIPVYFAGGAEIWPPKRKYPKLYGKAAIVFGSPLFASELPEGPSRIAHGLVKEWFLSSMGRLKSWVETSCQGLPP